MAAASTVEKHSVRKQENVKIRSSLPVHYYGIMVVFEAPTRVNCCVVPYCQDLDGSVGEETGFCLRETRIYSMHLAISYAED